tara:strand:- start:329 stop:598 length:270 start_codon:yes stop_codon:yes gene_type:complete
MKLTIGDMVRWQTHGESDPWTGIVVDETTEEYYILWLSYYSLDRKESITEGKLEDGIHVVQHVTTHIISEINNGKGVNSPRGYRELTKL